MKHTVSTSARVYLDNGETLPALSLLGESYRLRGSRAPVTARAVDCKALARLKTTAGYEIIATADSLTSIASERGLVAHDKSRTVNQLPKLKEIDDWILAGMVVGSGGYYDTPQLTAHFTLPTSSRYIWAACEDMLREAYKRPRENRVFIEIVPDVHGAMFFRSRLIDQSVKHKLEPKTNVLTKSIWKLPKQHRESFLAGLVAACPIVDGVIHFGVANQSTARVVQDALHADYGILSILDEMPGIGARSLKRSRVLRIETDDVRFRGLCQVDRVDRVDSSLAVELTTDADSMIVDAFTLQARTLHPLVLDLATV